MKRPRLITVFFGAAQRDFVAAIDLGQSPAPPVTIP
jgi:hypothetical protein